MSFTVPMAPNPTFLLFSIPQAPFDKLRYSFFSLHRLRQVRQVRQVLGFLEMDREKVVLILFVATQDRVFPHYVPNSSIKHSKSDSKDRS
jgi:hypothetical protein